MFDIKIKTDKDGFVDGFINLEDISAAELVNQSLTKIFTYSGHEILIAISLKTLKNEIESYKSFISEFPSKNIL